MPRIKGNSEAASTFLRAFRKSPSGPPPHKWPAPSVLRRWLRRPAFRAALCSIQQTLRLQSDFQLTSAAASAAGLLTADSKSPDLTAQQADKLAMLLRLSHLRQRFPATSHSHTNSSDPDDSDSEFDTFTKREKPISRFDILNNIHLLEPRMRVSDEELRDLAWRNHYPMPLLELPDFPKPADDPDNFYYNLLKDPWALLWWMKLYDESGNDHRYSPILVNCKHLVPDHRDEPLPPSAPPPPLPPPPIAMPPPPHYFDAVFPF